MKKSADTEPQHTLGHKDNDPPLLGQTPERHKTSQQDLSPLMWTGGKAPAPQEPSQGNSDGVTQLK